MTASKVRRERSINSADRVQRLPYCLSDYLILCTTCHEPITTPQFGAAWCRNKHQHLMVHLPAHPHLLRRCTTKQTLEVGLSHLVRLEKFVTVRRPADYATMARYERKGFADEVYDADDGTGYAVDSNWGTEKGTLSISSWDQNEPGLDIDDAPRRADEEVDTDVGSDGDDDN